MAKDPDLVDSNYKPAHATRVSATGAAAIASASVIVPIALSASTSPSPNHPRVFAWYTSLRKPGFKPPDWAFPLAWSAIEGSLGFSVYRVLRAAPSAVRTRAVALWSLNVLLIGAWSRLFFGRRHLGESTLAAAAMVATGAAYVRDARKVDKVAARAGLPFVGWVAFATVLTASIWLLNSKRRREDRRASMRDLAA